VHLQRISDGLSSTDILRTLALSRVQLYTPISMALQICRLRHSVLGCNWVSDILLEMLQLSVRGRLATKIDLINTVTFLGQLQTSRKTLQC